MISTYLFHLFGAVHFFFGCYYDYVHVNVPNNLKTMTSYGGKFKYLTFLNAMLQTTYFTVAFLNDIFGTNEPSPSQKPLLRKIKDGMFSSLAFPLAMFVGTSFWAIYAIDRELILPRSLDPYFPTWLNHVMHTNIIVFSLIELFSTFRMYPQRKLGVSILSAFMLLYALWVHFIYYMSGGWVYPVLAVLNWPLRITFYILSFGAVFGLYVVGERLNSSVWSKQIEDIERSGKKKAY